MYLLSHLIHNGKTEMRKLFRKYRTCLSFFLIAQLVLPQALFARRAQLPGFYGSVSNLPQIASNALPKVKPDGLIQGVAGLSRPQSNQLIVHQNKSRAIIDWESFNIGEDAWTHFDQHGNTDWAALNRIYDQNPSLIFGKLTADGKIYLINRNGILFGPGSQINVHSLAASSLDIDVQDFLGNTMHFTGDNARGVISNHGDIRAKPGGFVYLVAPDVENAGSIDVPSGRVALAAGNDVEMVILEAESRVFPFVYVQPGTRGTAANLKNGSITADTGVAGLYGRNVNQDGYIRSVTAVTNNGRIELHASENVTTGANSITESKITDNPESVHSSFGLTGGEIHVAGLDEKIVVQDQFQNQMTNTRRIVHAGAMTAKSGTVTLSAQERVYLESDSRIDVSGYWVRNSAAAVTVEAQLNSVELKNDHTQKDGILQGMTVVINPKEGSSIGDLSATLNSEYLTAREMATAGGEIRLSAPDGDIIVREDALLDFSGGGTIVSSGHYNTTKLVSGTR
ncbi:MAG: filamentous hemagglutinin N-terminal domain-containing protein, partial [Thermodesulfobacteriota bacterium]|nr:filamentous hemagglutinin N-terminal domain-containing protein [Thermodesulfobacteriota bacterium]